MRAAASGANGTPMGRNPSGRLSAADEGLMHSEPRLGAFLQPMTEVFHTVQHQHDLWKEDPFDVRDIHLAARQSFERLILQATTPPGINSGRILLLRGEAGSGKTHLLRSFRSYVHSQGI